MTTPRPPCPSRLASTVRLDERPLERRAFLSLLAALPAAATAAPGGLPDGGAAPEFRGIQRWFNSAPLTLASMKGRLVLVDFWTLACGNCIRTLPHVNRWATTYRGQGLVVVGVHTPEWPEERSAASVQAAIARYRIGHPVAMDNDRATWNAFENRFWPAFYLIDGQGRVRYRHFGEGDYARTEAAIRTLLARPGRA